MLSTVKEISGHIIDIHGRRIFTGTVTVTEGRISSIREHSDVPDRFLMPGFTDAHIHIESSMVTPYEFSRVACRHGTVATVSDPHEIANVCGMEGVRYMTESARGAAIKIFFGAPSCVPATGFETAGAVLGPDDVDTLLASDDIWYLSEMMNYPGVLHEDPDVMSKIASSRRHHKPVDGHAPGLRGEDARKYISHGITTDHECVTLDEALDKLRYGMKIIIREGSAAKNFEALHPLIGQYPGFVMFCSDDKHPDDLVEGHINTLVKRSLTLGYDLFDVLKIACINPLVHYGLPVGQLREGDRADFIVIEDTKHWNVVMTVIEGKVVYSDGKCHLAQKQEAAINNFDTDKIQTSDLKVTAIQGPRDIILAVDGSLITEKGVANLEKEDGFQLANPEEDILKICVINRYGKSKPAIGFIKNFGLRSCAIASTVAHDSHNIIAVGDDDELIKNAVNMLVESRGGLSFVSNNTQKHLPLPVAGLMSDKTVEEAGLLYAEMSSLAKSHGSRLHAPYMTLSFMALLVIPKIKMSDLGLFDAEAFRFYGEV